MDTTAVDDGFGSVLLIRTDAGGRTGHWQTAATSFGCRSADGAFEKSSRSRTGDDSKKENCRHAGPAAAVAAAAAAAVPISPSVVPAWWGMAVSLKMLEHPLVSHASMVLLSAIGCDETTDNGAERWMSWDYMRKVRDLAQR